MKEMTEDFVPRLNQFTELLKAAYQLHAKQIKQLGAWQTQLKDENKKLQEQLKKQYDEQQYKNANAANTVAKHLSATDTFKEKATEVRAVFQELVQQANEQLGGFSSHWGGYIENLGVQYTLAMLKKDYQVHTSIQKFKRWWHKSRNVEIDLLGISDTHLYVVEVKNQLKEDTFKQMLTVLEKIKEKVPEYAHLQIQPVFICVHAEEPLINTTVMSGVWIIRYRGFDNDDPKEEFEWLRKDR
ncbi:MAG: DUF234 domain-containing protein [Chitinophagaceae bacterium]